MTFSRDDLRYYVLWIVGVLFVILVLIAGVVLGIVFIPRGLHSDHRPKNPTFTVESSAVKSYTVTDDDSLSSTIEFSIRAHNRNSTRALMGFLDGEVRIRDGEHVHKIAKVKLMHFNMDAGGCTVLSMETDGDKVKLMRNVAGEMRVNAAVAGEGRVDLFMSGRHYVAETYNTRNWEVTCKDVVIEFSRSTDRVQKVECGVDVRELTMEEEGR